MNSLVPSHSAAILRHRSLWTWHLVQGHITQCEVMVWLSVLNFLITVDQTLLSDQIIYLAWHTGMIRLIGEISRICFILACMDSDGGPKDTPPRTSPLFDASDELFKSFATLLEDFTGLGDPFSKWDLLAGRKFLTEMTCRWVRSE